MKIGGQRKSKYADDTTIRMDCFGGYDEHSVTEALPRFVPFSEMDSLNGQTGPHLSRFLLLQIVENNS